MKNIKKYCSLLILIVIFCICGCVMVSGNTAENTLLKIPAYPLTEECISSALKEVQLDWSVVMEESEYDNHHTFSIYDQNGHLVAGLISAGNKKERGLTISTMNRFCNEYSEDSMFAPIKDKDIDKLLHLAAILYGGFEDEQWLAEDFYNNFSVTILNDENNLLEQHENSDFSQYECKNTFNDIKYQINSRITNDPETPEILAIGIYNAGKYIPFTDPINDDELCEAKPEITYTEIREDEFCEVYNRVSTKKSDFTIEKKGMQYRFYKVSLKENSYAPDYPFVLEIFLAVNLLSDGSDVMSVILFNDKDKTYTFDEETTRVAIAVKKNSHDEISLEGWLNISQLLILDEKNEIIQKKLFKYHTKLEYSIGE